MKFRDKKLYLIIPFIQIVFFILGYELINRFAHVMGWVDSKGVAWGISMEVYTLKYIIIIILSNLMNFFFSRKVLLISILSSIIFISFLLSILKHFPFRGLTVITLGIVGFFIYYFFHFKLKGTNP
jgi:hypothetical protein